MRIINTNLSELPLQNLVTEARNIVSGGSDLNKEKENLAIILDQVNFLLEKYDDIYSKFTEVFVAMGDFDFSKRLPFYDDKDNFINFIVSGINMINEELEASAIKKNIFHRLLTTLSLPDTLIVITDSQGFINLANAGNTFLVNFNDQILSLQGVNTLFADYEKIEERINHEGAVRNIECEFKWKGKLYPVFVDITISSFSGKIDSVIYLIKLQDQQNLSINQ